MFQRDRQGCSALVGYVLEMKCDNASQIAQHQELQNNVQLPVLFPDT